MITRSIGKISCLTVLTGTVLSACTTGASGVEPASVTRNVHSPDCIVNPPGPVGRRNASDSDAASRPGAFDLDCLRFLESQNEPGVASLAYSRAVSNQGNRNRLAAILIARSDEICTVEKALLLEHQATFNTIMSIAITALTGAATIVTGQLASDILTGTAGLLNASRDHVDTHVYRNQIIQTITTAIDTARQERLIAITQRRDRDNDEYTVDDMIRDVNSYHQLCSMGSGLQIAMETMGRENQNVERLAHVDEEIERLTEESNNLEGSAATLNQRRIQQLHAYRIFQTTGISITNEPE